MSWLAGTLELTSKVRYGLTSRGVPLFRFVPYDKRFSTYSVGCSMRDLSKNQHVIIEPSVETSDNSHKQQSKGILIQNFGSPTVESEKQLLLATYAYDSQKELRKPPVELKLGEPLVPEPSPRTTVTQGFTFHIDPPGCRDVDDSFTFIRCTNFWKVYINIADVAAWIPADSTMNTFASKRTTTFYSTEGKALAPMLPLALSEGQASLLPGELKPTLSLTFDWYPGKPINSFRFIETMTQTTMSFTYEQAGDTVLSELKALRQLAVEYGGVYTDSHTWVQIMMIMYNEQAGMLLHSHKKGILRRHSAPKQEKLEMISALNDPTLLILAYEAAEYCLATDESYHYGLDKSTYAYASSPLRRYADLVNQRLLKAILNFTINRTAAPSADLVEYLNRRQKQAKAFTRDMFFLTVLASTTTSSVTGKIIAKKDNVIRVWVPAWRRIIKTRSDIGVLYDTVNISWYDNRESPRWKERMVFRLTVV